MMRFFKILMARVRKPVRHHSQRLREQQCRPRLEPLEDRMAPACLIPTDPCIPADSGLLFPHNPSFPTNPCFATNSGLLFPYNSG
jgi:hypothetical protein